MASRNANRNQSKNSTTTPPAKAEPKPNKEKPGAGEQETQPPAAAVPPAPSTQSEPPKSEEARENESAPGDENPLETMLDEESDSAPAATPLDAASQAAPETGEVKSEDEEPDEVLPSEAADIANTGTVRVEAPENPAPYPTAYIPAPSECLSDGPKFRNRRFVAAPAPAEMSLASIDAEIELLGNPGQTRDELAQLCADARKAKAEAILLHDIAISTAEQAFREFDEWFYGANHRLAALRQEDAERRALIESAKQAAPGAKTPPAA